MSLNDFEIHVIFSDFTDNVISNGFIRFQAISRDFNGLNVIIITISIYTIIFLEVRFTVPFTPRNNH